MTNTLSTAPSTVRIRRSGDRGFADHGWLRSRHTFSFADYHDPSHMGFGPLRVINEDHIDGGTGFGKHPHRDMEIISYVVSGALQHEDSMGNKAVILPGEVQRMSAGTGVTHSEYNHISDTETHFFQIWIMPATCGTVPGYGQKDFTEALNRGERVLVVSKDGRDGSIAIDQDADIYLARLQDGRKTTFVVRPGRGVWLQVVKGSVQVSREDLREGDAVAISGDVSIEVVAASSGAEVMIFDMVE